MSDRWSGSSASSRAAWSCVSHRMRFPAALARFILGTRSIHPRSAAPLSTAISTPMTRRTVPGFTVASSTLSPVLVLTVRCSARLAAAIVSMRSRSIVPSSTPDRKLSSQRRWIFVVSMLERSARAAT